VGGQIQATFCIPGVCAGLKGWYWLKSGALGTNYRDDNLTVGFAIIDVDSMNPSPNTTAAALNFKNGATSPAIVRAYYTFL
jgi:hypothetical protein